MEYTFICHSVNFEVHTKCGRSCRKRLVHFCQDFCQGFCILWDRQCVTCSPPVFQKNLKVTTRYILYGKHTIHTKQKKSPNKEMR
jgi:hypothetical protein